MLFNSYHLGGQLYFMLILMFVNVRFFTTKIFILPVRKYHNEVKVLGLTKGVHKNLTRLILSIIHVDSVNQISDPII